MIVNETQWGFNVPLESVASSRLEEAEPETVARAVWSHTSGSLKAHEVPVCS